MASGFGCKGGMTGRCYSLWMDFSECMSDASEPQKCFSKRDDYLECLHHRKEIQRLNIMASTAKAEMKRQEAEIWATAATESKTKGYFTSMWNAYSAVEELKKAAA
eukprot:CAMPEP_0114259300 /NCGR_PEP_ID=MMETSP0058-20121206/19817_1 /TAXON_ID=36894 /ORGANISM="Pyramimonas parkeae, CCMP726" /LENGTH=105 /DNA_ID=CAMNT_0001374333 /DNA_START=36 /DNA_END=353 /DNA_ORIENTATION=-